MLLQDVCAWTLQLFLWQKYTAEKSTWLSVKYFNNNGLSRVYFLLEPFISRCYAFTYQSRCLCFCMWQHIMKKTCSGHCTLCECHDLCHRCRLPPTFAKAGCENDVGEAKHSSLKAHISTFIFPTVLSSRTSGRVSRWHVSKGRREVVARAWTNLPSPKQTCTEIPGNCGFFCTCRENVFKGRRGCKQNMEQTQRENCKYVVVLKQKPVNEGKFKQSFKVFHGSLINILLNK